MYVRLGQFFTIWRQKPSTWEDENKKKGRRQLDSPVLEPLTDWDMADVSYAFGNAATGQDAFSSSGMGMWMERTGVLCVCQSVAHSSWSSFQVGGGYEQV